MIATPMRRRSAASRLDGLLRSWQAAASAQLGFPPSVWSVPACAAVVHAALTGTDPIPPARRFGRQRASVGFTLDETVVDLGVVATLDAHAARAIDRLPVGAAVAEGHSPRDVEHCVDPLTGLVNRGYLAARLAEAQRQAWSVGAAPSSTFHVLVFRLPSPTDLPHALAGTFAASEALRRTFEGGESVATLSPRLFAVLRPLGPVPVVSDLPSETVCWVDRMPDDEQGLRTLLDDLR